jgi:hypothetical protein
MFYRDENDKIIYQPISDTKIDIEFDLVSLCITLTLEKQQLTLKK